jgi:hypothetical protein
MSAKLPTDHNTPDMGSSMLLPTFDFDTRPNGGVEDGASQPEAYGLSELPDGVVTSEEIEDVDMPEFTDPDIGIDFDDIGMVLGSELDVATGSVSGLPQDEYSEDRAHQDNTSNVTDFSWLEDTVQDPSRLPNLNTNTVIPELVDAWGTRTDGVHRVEMTDRREIQAHEDMGNDAAPKVANDELRRVLARAMRRSAYGDDLLEIKKEIIQTLRHEAMRLAKPVKAMTNEHGLVGNVYVRASAFPGIDQKKWAKHVRAKCPNARYLIACGSCDACQANNCADCACNRHLGMKVVKKVPWNAAFAHYAPLLAATGRLASAADLARRSATVTDKRLALKHAFLSPSRDMSARVRDDRPIHKTPVERVTAEEARAAFEASTPKARKVVDAKAVKTKRQMAKVQAKIGQWVKASLLSKKEAKTLLASSAGPKKVLQKAARMITARQETGSYQGDGKHYESGVSASDAYGALHEAAQDEPEDSAFPKLAGETLREAQKMIRWTRQAMTEGFMGKDLTDTLKGRFSKKLRKQAKTQLVQIRRKHEGLAGTAYVDAEAYASRTGTTGCEKGAAKHRANGLPALLEMDRCASCVHRNQDEVCNKYNKVLVSDGERSLGAFGGRMASESELSAWQAEQIRLADAPDAEVTASMFAPSEFNLSNERLDGFDIEDAPALEDLSEYSFGGTIMHGE